MVAAHRQLMLPTGVSALHLLVVLTLVIREAVETAHNIGCPAPAPNPDSDYASYYYYTTLAAHSLNGPLLTR